MPGEAEIWNEEQYDDLSIQDGSVATWQGKRPRRRRRHAKKQAAAGTPQDDRKGNWKPPSSGTSLTLAQLGINLPPTPPTKRNVVTCSDLDLFGQGKIDTKSTDVARRFANLTGNSDTRYMHSSPLVTVPTPQRPQSCSTIITSSSPWPGADMTLLASSPCRPQGAIAAGRPPYMPTRPEMQSMPMHPTPTWVSEQEVAPRHWLCSGQYGFEPVFHQAADSIPPQMFEVADSIPPQMYACPTTPTAPAPTECTDLEVLLRNLASEAYED